MQSKPDWLDRSTILRGVVGSTAHGLNIEGVSDTEEMGVCIEPIEEALTLGDGFQQFIYRDAEARTGIADAPSLPGELEYVIYGLRKFCRLAANGNPSIMLMFYLPNAAKNSLGSQLQEMAPKFLSKRTGGAFLGYMQAQRQRLLGERGQKRTKRPELEEKYGFDTKYAMHILRLGSQGVELLETGSLTLPMQGDTHDYLRGVRQGAVSLQDVLTKAGELEQRLKDLLDTVDLPKLPDTEAIERWLQQRYLQWWKAQDVHYRAEGMRLIPYRPWDEKVEGGWITKQGSQQENCEHLLNAAKGMAGAKE